eukprot:COSAG01_NODE_2708_length_7219_cov_2.933146_7_plen_189_part_00
MLKHGMSRNAGVSRLLSHCFGSYRETRQAAALQPTKQVRRLETTVADLRKQLDKEALLRESLRADLQVPLVCLNACPHTPRVLGSKSYARTRSHRMHASAAVVCARSSGALHPEMFVRRTRVFRTRPSARSPSSCAPRCASATSRRSRPRRRPPRRSARYPPACGAWPRCLQPGGYIRTLGYIRTAGH